MDLVLVIMSEIIRYEGLSVSQCMWRLTTHDGTRGPSARVFPNPANLNAHDDVGGYGARPPAHFPNTWPGAARPKAAAPGDPGPLRLTPMELPFVLPNSYMATFLSCSIKKVTPIELANMVAISTTRRESWENGFAVVGLPFALTN
jgi:hypothetical protein